MASKTASKAGNAGKVSAPVTQEQLEQLMSQNAELLAQNQTLTQMVAGMGAQVSAQETAKRFVPKQAKVTEDMLEHIADVYALKNGLADAKELVAEGKSACGNIRFKLDEKAQMLWVGHSYAEAHGTVEKSGNHRLYSGFGRKSVRLEHMLANGELLDITYGVPQWVSIYAQK
jgi:hypothetical protein